MHLDREARARAVSRLDRLAAMPIDGYNEAVPTGLREIVAETQGVASRFDLTESQAIEHLALIALRQPTHVALLGEPADDALRYYWFRVGGPRDRILRRRPGRARPPTGAIFLNRWGQRMSRNSVAELVRRRGEEIGIFGLTPHHLRHTFATHMMNGGANMRVIQELLRHEWIETTQRYTHVATDHLHEVYLRAHPRATRDERTAQP